MSYLNFTKQHIFNAFDELLSEIPFDKITVQMIIDRSGVSRTSTTGSISIPWHSAST